MRMQVDWTLCDAHGTCALHAPHVVGRDAWGYPLLPARDLVGPDRAEARRAVALCPRLALRLEK